MGFAQLGVFAVLMTAGVVFGSFAVSSLMNMEQEMRDAESIRDQRESSVRVGSLSVDAPAYNPGQDRVTLQVTNTGDGMFNTSRTDVIIDGIVVTQNITSLEIDGVATNVWSPQSEVTIVIADIPSAPDDVVVITGNGVKGYWRS